MGVVFARFEDGDKILAVARNSERNLVSTEENTEVVEVTGTDVAGEEAPNE
jgi:DNA gyrase subunit A